MALTMSFISKCSANTAFALVMLAGILDLYPIAYDPSMINNLNVVEEYLEYFNIDNNIIGLNSAMVAAGCVVGGPFVGPLLDRLGRIKGLLVGAVVAVIGAIIQIASPNEACLLVGRFLLGISFTISGSGVPMWVMELSPPTSRGIRVGILMSSLPVAALVVCGFVLGTYQFESNWSWRSVMLGEIFGPGLFLILMPFMPESPRWLISKGRKEEALTILTHLYGDKTNANVLVTEEFDKMCASIELEVQNHASWKALVSPAPNRRRFFIALATNIFFQINGSNTILYFITIILANAGIVDVGLVLCINLGITAFDTLSVWSGAYLIELVGRKRMLVWCTIAMTLTFVMMAALISQYEASGNVNLSYAAIGVMSIFLFGSCASWQILTYSYPQEILSYSQRAKGTAVAQAIGWAFSFLSIYTFPIALAAMSWRFYAVNAAWNVLIIVAMQVFFVETKGVSLEDVDRIFGTAPEDIEGIAQATTFPKSEESTQVKNKL